MPPGFTLIELLLAMGLFAVSMAMVAALFPAALYQAKVADEHTMATVIGENAITTIKIRIPYGHTDLPADAVFVPLPISTTGPVHEQDMLYPLDPNIRSQNTKYGWVGLVRCLGNNANDYVFVVVPYAISRTAPPRDYDLQADPNDDCPMPRYFDDVPVTVSGDGAFVTADIDPNFIAIGSPVILDTGQYAFIVGRTDDPVDPQAILSGTLGVATGATTDKNMWVYGGGGRDLDSPAIGCFTFRTSLRVNP